MGDSKAPGRSLSEYMQVSPINNPRALKRYRIYPKILSEGGARGWYCIAEEGRGLTYLYPRTVGKREKANLAVH